MAENVWRASPKIMDSMKIDFQPHVAFNLTPPSAMFDWSSIRSVLNGNSQFIVGFNPKLQAQCLKR